MSNSSEKGTSGGEKSNSLRQVLLSRARSPDLVLASQDVADMCHKGEAGSQARMRAFALDVDIKQTPAPQLPVSLTSVTEPMRLFSPTVRYGYDVFLHWTLYGVLARGKAKWLAKLRFAGEWPHVERCEDVVD